MGCRLDFPDGGVRSLRECCTFHVFKVVVRLQLKTACGVHSLQPHFDFILPGPQAVLCSVVLLLFSQSSQPPAELEDLPLLEVSL